MKRISKGDFDFKNVLLSLLFVPGLAFAEAGFIEVISDLDTSQKGRLEVSGLPISIADGLRSGTYEPQCDIVIDRTNVNVPLVKGNLLHVSYKGSSASRFDGSWNIIKIVNEIELVGGKPAGSTLVEAVEAVIPDVISLEPEIFKNLNRVETGSIASDGPGQDMTFLEFTQEVFGTLSQTVQPSQMDLVRQKLKIFLSAEVVDLGGVLPNEALSLETYNFFLSHDGTSYDMFCEYHKGANPQEVLDSLSEVHHYSLIKTTTPQ